MNTSLRLLAALVVVIAIGWSVRVVEAQEPGGPRVVLTPEQQRDPKAIKDLADTYMVRKYYPEAVQLYLKLTELEPRNATYYNMLGIAYHQMQDLSHAKKSYQKAVQLKPDYGEAMNNLAAVQYSQKNYRDAIFTYMKALRLTPQDAVVYSNLGTAYFALQKYDYAMQSYRYALLLDPQIFQRQGRTGSIVQQREIKDLGAFNFYMAKTYASMGNLDAAFDYLRKAYEENFKDIRKGLEDKAFDALRQDPRYTEFVALLDQRDEEKAAAERQ